LEITQISLDGFAIEAQTVNMRRIIQANINRLKELLKTEPDPTKRAMEKRLLAEEETKLKQLAAHDKKEAKAY
jgi:hypothetical protein